MPEEMNETIADSAECKRKCGGQPGNRNAFKHGLYGRALSPSDKNFIGQAALIEGLDEEIAILRLRLVCHLKSGNDRLLNQTASTLAKLYTVRKSIAPADKNVIRNALDRVFKEVADPIGAAISKAVLKDPEP